MMGCDQTFIDCNDCERVFTHESDLRKHSFKKHLKIGPKEDLNNTITSLEELKSRQLVFPLRKRSIFDGVDVRALKRRKIEETSNTIISEKAQKFKDIKPYEKVEKFLLTFNCKECTLTFTKFGQFRAHTESHASNSSDYSSDNTNIQVETDKDEHFEKSNHQRVFEKQKCRDIKLTKKYPSCEDCSTRFNVLEDFRKPFSMNVQKKLLKKLPTHISNYPGFVKIDSKFPVVRPRSVVKLGEDEFIVGELKGEGGFAKVYSACWSNSPENEGDLVIKIQKPANDWEWYILTELQVRLRSLNHVELGEGAQWKDSFMSSSRCFTYDEGSIIVSQLQKYGTLLDMINITSAADKAIAEPLAIHLTAEILGLVDILHSMDFIHADLKPDNFMIKDIPGRASTAIQIIDFGKTIDLKTIPKDTVFDDIVETSGLKTVEMREKRPWRHHIDYFGVAAVVYCLLFGQYMEVTKVRGRWVPKGTYKRWWKVDFWKRFFDEFLNIKGADKECLPSLLSWRREFVDIFHRENMASGLNKAREVLERKCLVNRRRTM